MSTSLIKLSLTENALILTEQIILNPSKYDAKFLTEKIALKITEKIALYPWKDGAKSLARLL